MRNRLILITYALYRSGLARLCVAVPVASRALAVLRDHLLELDTSSLASLAAQAISAFAALLGCFTARYPDSIASHPSLTYSLESVRLATFSSFSTSELSPSKLAQDGFYLVDDEHVRHFAAARPLEATFAFCDQKQRRLLQAYQSVMVAGGQGPSLLGWNVAISTALAFSSAQTCQAHSRQDLETDELPLSSPSPCSLHVTSSKDHVIGTSADGSVSIFSIHPTVNPWASYNARDCEAAGLSEHGLRFSIAAAYPKTGSSVPLYANHAALATMAEDDVWDTIELGQIVSTHLLDSTSLLASALAFTVTESLDDVGVVVSIHTFGRRIAKLVEYARTDDGFFK